MVGKYSGGWNVKKLEAIRLDQKLPCQLAGAVGCYGRQSAGKLERTEQRGRESQSLESLLCDKHGCLDALVGIIDCLQFSSSHFFFANRTLNFRDSVAG